jgi:hypothetical protein
VCKNAFPGRCLTGLPGDRVLSIFAHMGNISPEGYAIYRHARTRQVICSSLLTGIQLPGMQPGCDLHAPVHEDSRSIIITGMGGADTVGNSLPKTHVFKKIIRQRIL